MSNKTIRNLSGIYFFEFDENGNKNPICFEDCKEDTQDKILETKNREFLVGLIKALSRTINKIGDQFDLYANIPEEDEPT